MRGALKKLGIFMFGLYFLSLTPVADVSSKIPDAVLPGAGSSSHTPLSLEEKALNPLKTRDFTDFSQNQDSLTSSKKTMASTGLSAASETTAKPSTKAVATKTAASKSGNYISVNGKNISIFTANASASGYLPDSGSKVGAFRGVFYYGHNTTNVFGSLKDLRPGDTFSITTSGKTVRYQVAVKKTYDRSEIDHSSNSDVARLANIYRARLDGRQYDVSLMTCAGASYGNGDASHRLVIYATAI